MPERDLYRPFATVQPTERATPSISIAFPEVRFSDAIGRALGDLGQGYGVLGHAREQVGAAFAHMGGALEHAGNEIFARATAIKTVQNQTDAWQAETKYRLESSKMQNAFENQEGDSATKSLDAHMKGLDDLRQKVRGTLNNDQARGFYDEHSLRAMGAMVWNAGKHAATQGKKAAVDSAQASWLLTLDEIAKDPDNPDNQRKYEEGRQNFVHTIAPLTGDVGPKLELKLRDMESSFHSSMISGIAKKDTTRARAELEKWQGHMLAPDIEKVDNTITNNELRSVPRILAQKNTEDMSKKKTNQELENEPGLREREDKALEELAQHPSLTKNPEVYAEAKRNTIQAVQQAFNKVEAERKNDRDRALRTIDLALSGEQSPDKKPPETLDEARAQLEPGKFDAAIATLRTRADREYVTKGLSINQARLREVDPMVSYARWERLRGMASSGHVSEFLDETTKLYELGLNRAERTKVDKLREKLLGNPTGDPRVQEAWRELQISRAPEMHALGIDGPRNKENAEDWDAAHGALEDALDSFRENVGRPPTREEIREKIGKSVLKHRAGSWRPWKSEEFPTWSSKTEVPEKWKDEYDRRLIADSKKPPENHDDPEYRRAYVHMLFLDSLKHPEAPEAPISKSKIVPKGRTRTPSEPTHRPLIRESLPPLPSTP